MAAFTPTTSYGTQLFYGDASNTVTTEVDNVLTVGVPMSVYTPIDVSHLGSTIRKYVMSIPDGGELSFTCHHKAALLNTLNGLLATEKWWKIGFPDTSGDVIFQGFLTNIEESYGDVDTIPEITCTVKINSAKTITAGS